MHKIFISHPYSDNPEKRLKQVDIICKTFINKGNSLPISPLHSFSFFDIENKRYRDGILNACKDLLDISNLCVFYRYNNVLSKGQKVEMDYCERNNINFAIIDIKEEN